MIKGQLNSLAFSLLIRVYPLITYTIKTHRRIIMPNPFVLIKLYKHSRYIKSIQEYYLWRESDEHVTPIREELFHWKKALGVFG
jgi:hypothetical protein